MVERIMEAYNTEYNKMNNIKSNFLKTNIWTKIALGFLIVGFFVEMAALLFANSTAIIVCSLLYGIGTYILTLISQKISAKAWKINVNVYNERLNFIARLLKEADFDMYEKNKIKQLIRKFNRVISDAENNEKQKSDNVTSFLSSYILPIVAFTCGQVGASYDTVNLISVTIAGLLVVVFGKFLISSFAVILKEAEGNKIEEKKQMVIRLQDLLDRDFEILDGDILE